MDWLGIWDRLIDKETALGFLEARDKYLSTIGGYHLSLDEMRDADEEYTHAIIYCVTQVLIMLCEARLGAKHSRNS